MGTKHDKRELTKEMIDKFNEALADEGYPFRFLYDETPYGSGLGNIVPPSSRGVKNFKIEPSYNFYIWAAIWFKEKYDIKIETLDDGSSFSYSPYEYM